MTDSVLDLQVLPHAIELTCISQMNNSQSKRTPSINMISAFPRFVTIHRIIIDESLRATSLWSIH